MADPQKRTEDELIALLRQRHNQQAGNGEAWAFVTHVRDAAGFDASRTLDAIAMSLWPSRGLQLSGFEIKCSRSDWLRELKSPAKAEAFCHRLDRFWIVAASNDIVRLDLDELPPTWGLLVAMGKRLVSKVDAPALRDLTPPSHRAHPPLPPDIDRSFLAALLRSACRVGAATPEEIVEARQEARRDAEEHQTLKLKLETERADRAEQMIHDFEQAAGVRLNHWAPGGNRGPTAVGEAVRAVLDGTDQVENVRQQLARLYDQAARIHEFVGEQTQQMGAEAAA